MLSILICSIKKDLLEKLKLNLKETTGVDYELLVSDNATVQKPLCEVYNELASRASRAFWCFIHEDIAFLTPGWGLRLIESFNKNPETGLIGVAGARYKSKTPSGWSTGIPSMDCCNIFHDDSLGTRHRLYSNPMNAECSEVVNVDGVFMAIRKEVWPGARFNETLLRGFHLYDIDFSFQVIRTWKAAVLFNIDILHFTEGGSFGDAWMKYTLDWHQAYQKELPSVLKDHPDPETMEKKIRRNWLYRLSTEKIAFSNKLKWLRKSRSWEDLRAWPYAILFLTGKFYKKSR